MITMVDSVEIHDRILQLDETVVIKELEEINKTKFKYKQLLHFQIEGAVSLIKKKDAVIIQPTGAGKSLTFLVCDGKGFSRMA